MDHHAIVSDSNVEEIGCGLRDFFIASCAAEMLAAYKQLQPHGDLPDITAIERFEFAFNRLFVGPQPPLAPPFASVYLEQDQLLMGQTTRDARDLYTSIGLTSPWAGTFPDDHIALEIDACLHMHRLIKTTQNQAVTLLYRQFLDQHLLLWVPQFSMRIQATENIPANFQAVSKLLIAWLPTGLAAH